MFCYHNDYNLILQDRYNSIGKEFNLFSVVELPNFIERTNITQIIPVDDFKSLVKFNLYGNFTLIDKISYSFFYLTGLKSNHFIKNFNFDKDINSFFLSNYNKVNENSLEIYWKYTLDTKNIFKQFERDLCCQDFIPDLSIQIRGGDKVEESLTLGRTPSSVEQYLEICFDEIKKSGNDNLNIYIMTDTYSYFQIIKNRLLAVYPNIDIRSFVSSDQEGHLQSDFNSLDNSVKINSYYFFLYELEMLRKASICIGSFNSNIFYLGFLIRYQKNNKFISVDTTFENSFL
ncbi:hypothetical protein FFWV33_07750 [Flavobacterium faecale]|uniref:Uncharacterized protein n=2 Tax=Flavobacterium faecale TaxID=1355330 RepID=A0A2S1LCG3_9FLAO|nr:hypothetical protein FFWV33_07750 [Flavobacterium faecale]